MSQVLPHSFRQFRILRTVMGDEAIALDMWLLGFKREGPQHHGGETEIRLGRMQADRLWCPEVVVRAEDNDARVSRSYGAMHFNPTGTRVVAVQSTATFAGDEVSCGYWVVCIWTVNVCGGCIGGS